MLRQPSRPLPRRSTTPSRAVVPIALLVAACASAPRAEIEPRYVAVHNALAAIGLSQTGPIQQGSLAEGREARVPLELGAQCTTVVALGGEGVRDLDVSLLDAADKPVAHDTTRDAQAVVRACVEQAGTYTLVVRMREGAGSFLAATWSGGATPGGAPGAAPAAVVTAAGTCESPIALMAGVTTGSTSRGESDNEGSCANSSSRELVYKLDLPGRQRVTIDVDPRFDAVLYVRKEECADAEAEVACNDDVGHERKSRVDEVLDAGTYFVFVDGYSNEAGAFKMTTVLADIPSLADVCRQARPLASGTAASGSTAGAFDSVQSTCGDGAKGADAIYRLDLAQRARVRVTEHSDEFPPVVHLRRACADEQSEIACSNDGMTDDDVAYTGVLDPGSYTVFADGSDRDTQGQYTLLAEAAPEHGAGTQGDTCADAVPLTKSDHVEGDTFAARDDVAGKCGGAGAGDVVYRVDVPRRVRVTARMTKQESRHVFVLSRACGDRTAEVACGASLDEVLAPGTYALAVDGATPESFGRFAFDWRVRDVAGQEGACRGAPPLSPGQTVKGTTDGAADNFSTSCGGREETQSNPDRLYRLTLAARTKVRLTLATPTWDGVLVVRRACVESAAGASPGGAVAGPPSSPPSGPRGATRAAEVVCNNDFEDAHHSKIETTLDPGTYFVLVDGHATGNQGPFTLEYAISR
jgi:hypothetical protein